MCMYLCTDKIFYHFGVYKYMQSTTDLEHECAGCGLGKGTNLLLK